MLRYAIRRVLWAIPTLFGISLVVFFVTTLLPDPAENAAARGGDPTSARILDEQRRARFLDLPRFFNSAPQDVAARADAEMAHLVAADEEQGLAAARLVALGGAALPYVLPKLEGLAPDARGRVALALAPIAQRMGVATADTTARADLAIAFWTHFWEDRALDFTGPAVHRAVQRLVEHGTDLREHDLLQVDTYALPELFLAMTDPATDRVALERLTRLAAHATGRGSVIPPDAGATFVRRALADWVEFWYVHRTDYVLLEGPEKLTAALGETRYGKWLMRAVTGHFGLSARDGEPIADKLKVRAPLTLLIAALAMLLSFALAVPVGTLTAWRKGKPVDIAFAALLFGMFSLPTFWAAEMLRRTFVGLSSDANMGPDRLILPVATLTIGSLATLARYQRTAMLDVVRQDYVRTARAKGVSTFRWVVVHALRNALLPTVTLAGLQLPALLGGAFVVEEVFVVPGLGYETLRAIESHDAAWLMATIVLAALVTTVGLLASDVAYGVLDPRIREALIQKQERT